MSKSLAFVLMLALIAGAPSDRVGSAFGDDRVTQADWNNGGKSPADQYAMDAKMWLNVIEPDISKATKQRLLKAEEIQLQDAVARIFALLATGDVQYRSSKGGERVKFTHSTASLLSHGGRVMVAVKNADRNDALLNWITSGETGKFLPGKLLFTRMSTHGVDVKDGKLTESKGIADAVAAKLFPGRHTYGINIPMGGLDSTDAEGNPVVADGRHGHILIFWKKLDPKECGYSEVLLIGCENSAPQKTSHLGTEHGASGASADVSATAGAKWNNMGTDKFESLDSMRMVVSDMNQLNRALLLAYKMTDDKATCSHALTSPPNQ